MKPKFVRRPLIAQPGKSAVMMRKEQKPCFPRIGSLFSSGSGSNFLIGVHSRSFAVTKNAEGLNPMDNIQNGLLFKEEVYQIVGSAMEVAKELGCGFLEAVYQEALEMEFAAQRIPYEAQKPIRISYKGKILSKEYIADFVCNGEILIELKAIKQITEIEEAQVLNYLKATHLPLGLIINFGTPQLQWKRYANTKRNRE